MHVFVFLSVFCVVRLFVDSTCLNHVETLRGDFESSRSISQF
jgi:hypothetical protein